MNPPQEATSVRAVRSRKFKAKKSNVIETEIEQETFLAEPFCDDELATPEEFETLDNLDNDFELIDRLVKEESRKKAKAAKAAPIKTVPTKVKTKRRRQIDPATCERDYSQDELEFMNALSEYKRSSGRMFPTCSEILEVLKGLGYEKFGAASEEE